MIWIFSSRSNMIFIYADKQSGDLCIVEAKDKKEAEEKLTRFIQKEHSDLVNWTAGEDYELLESDNEWYKNPAADVLYLSESVIRPD